MARKLSSYHTHTAYCDGVGTVAQVVEAAIAAGLTEIGISSHAPLPFATDWTMAPEDLHAYVREVQAAADIHGDRISVLLGAEIDFIPDARVAAFQRETVMPLGFDYFVGSVHFLGQEYPPRSFDGTEAGFNDILRDEYGGSVEAMVADYYGRMRAMLPMPGVRILGHFDVISRWNADRAYFTEREPWYRSAVDETLAAVAASGHLLELNTVGWRKGLGRPYPASWILDRCRELGIPIIVSSDAHIPGDVDWGFDEARTYLTARGVVPVDGLPGSVSGRGSPWRAGHPTDRQRPR